MTDRQSNRKGSSRKKRRRGGAGGKQGSGGDPRRRGGSRRSGRSGRRKQGGRGGGGRDSGPGRRPQGEPTLEVHGILQVTEQGHGFLRSAEENYNPAPADPVVPPQLIRDLGLENGLEIDAMAVPNPARNRGAWVERIVRINGMEPGEREVEVPFHSLVAESPNERIRLEYDSEDLSTRVVDMITPIGKGQRCLIVAPPKAGKTVLLQKIAHAITANHPEIHLIVLLVDERPEEVTDMRRSVRGEVIASSSDEMARNHVQVAEVVLERAKRLVEDGRDVVILLDSITRLSRAYNTEQRGSGRVLSGGIDARTMEKPRKFFGAARNAVDGGSLTVIGTSLVDTGSRMDDVIFQEFKGTGNTEIVMDRRLFELRIYPSIDISLSGTRKEEKLFEPKEYQQIMLLRRALASLRPAEAMQLLVERMARYKSNADFLENLQR
jgi:transcription termination factor Rho